ncbi:flavodoxin-dependent (E)-4-hydroxy-3-methylbut-2-enyl-diphosphate synthase [Anaplasmataceae bacterium AB001_6]|nr:flavodoxin-dependent (E)-4-hydroxy-3-methylbut-2-enyl-diphosphate synthase [Anaplasmataceae bacterium AB001_6]
MVSKSAIIIDPLFEDVFNLNTEKYIIQRQNIVKPEVKIGKITIGGNNPVAVQSMTSGLRTDNNDPKKIAEDEAKECIKLANAGSEMVRIALNSENVAKSLPYLKDILAKNDLADLPIIGCGQFELHGLVKKYPDEIKLLDKLRINPGNVGFSNKRDKNFEDIVSFAAQNDMPIRIGVNWGSIDADLLDTISEIKNCKGKVTKDILLKVLVYCVIKNAQAAENIGLNKNKIVVSCKLSDVNDLIKVTKIIGEKFNYVQHLGLTESGMGTTAIVRTSVALSQVLSQGIGETIRASLTPSSYYDRTEEVKVCKEVLQSMEKRFFVPKITSCPGCGRTNSTDFQILTESVQKYVNKNLGEWSKKYIGINKLKIAVMGCIVNGPGESKHADIGISMPGYKEKPTVAVYIKSKYYKTLKGTAVTEIEQQFFDIIEEFLEQEYEKTIA